MGKILLFPFYVVKFAFSIVATVIKAIFATGTGAVKFGFRNLPGLVIGAVAALIGAKIMANRKTERESD